MPALNEEYVVITDATGYLSDLISVGKIFPVKRTIKQSNVLIAVDVDVSGKLSEFYFTLGVNCNYIDSAVAKSFLTTIEKLQGLKDVAKKVVDKLSEDEKIILEIIAEFTATKSYKTIEFLQFNYQGSCFSFDLEGPFCIHYNVRKDGKPMYKLVKALRTLYGDVSVADYHGEELDF